MRNFRPYLPSALLLVLIAGLFAVAQNNTTSLVPLIIPGSIPSGSRQGSTGTKVFMCTGSFTSGHLVSADANGNCIDSGTANGGLITGPLFSATASATVNSGSLGTLIGSGTGSLTLGANYFGTAGNVLHVFASGTYGTAATPGVLAIEVFLGGVKVAQGAQTPVGSEGNVWSINCYIVSRVPGSSGTLMSNCLMVTNEVSAATAPAQAWGLVDQGNSFNTTGTLAFDLDASWQSFASGDTITGTTVVLGQI